MRDFIVVYDASCGPCKDFKRAVNFLDASQKIGFMSLLEADTKGRLASLPASVRFRSFHMILPGGEIRSGSDALPDLVGLLPVGGLVSKAMASVPLGPRITRSVYSVISRLHGMGSCASRKGGEPS